MDISQLLTGSQNYFLDKTLNYQVLSWVNDSRKHYKLYIIITFRWLWLLLKAWLWKSIFQNQEVVGKLVSKLEMTASQLELPDSGIFYCHEIISYWVIYTLELLFKNLGW